MKHTIKTNLKGLKKWAWKKNLTGFFSVDGTELTDEQVRIMVDWAISKGYEYDADIPNDEVVKLLNMSDSNPCTDEQKIKIYELFNE